MSDTDRELDRLQDLLAAIPPEWGGGAFIRRGNLTPYNHGISTRYLADRRRTCAE